MFNPIREYVRSTWGMTAGGKTRINEFMSAGHAPKEEIALLKHEYGTGGFGGMRAEPCKVIYAMRDAAGHTIRYVDENSLLHELNLTYEEIRKEIHRCIAEGVYVEELYQQVIGLFTEDANGQLRFC